MVKVNNVTGPQDSQPTPGQKLWAELILAEQKNTRAPLPSSTVLMERLTNLEVHSGMKGQLERGMLGLTGLHPHHMLAFCVVGAPTGDVTKRLRALELRLLHLEGHSPEYD